MMTVRDGRMCKVQGQPTKLVDDMVPIGDNENVAVRPRDAVSFLYLYDGPGKAPKWGLSFPKIPAATGAPKGMAAMARM
jgi:hypothetical protein